MILIYSDNHEPAPYLDSPLIERNFERQARPIYIKMRKVRGKTGWFLRRYGHFFGSPPRSDQEALAHHGVQVGEYVMELTREKYLVGQRLSGHQIWESTVGHKIVGYTDLSDEDIQMESLQAQDFVRRRYGGKYHIKHNNCQTFIRELLRRILTIPLSSYSDGYTSSVSDSSLLDEKASITITSTSSSPTASLTDVTMSDAKIETKTVPKKTPITVIVSELQHPRPTRVDMWKTSHFMTTSVVSVC